MRPLCSCVVWRRRWCYSYLTSVNSCISVNHNLLNDNPKKWCNGFCNKEWKSKKFWSSCNNFDADVTSLNFDVIEILRHVGWFLRHNSINRDNIFSECSQFTFLQRLYLLVKFQDDQSSRTCWTKNLSF